MNKRADFDAKLAQLWLSTLPRFRAASNFSSAPNASRTALSRGLFSAVKCFATPSGLYSKSSVK